MNSNTPRDMSLPLSSRPFWQNALMGVGTVLALVWVGVWLLKLQVEVGMAASIAATCIGLAVVALRGDLGRQARAAVRQPRRPAADVSEASAPGDTSNQNRTAPANDKRWSLDVFAHIDARRFTAVCETWFAWAGFDTRSETHRTEEGVDIWLHAARMPGPVAIVRCKHRFNKPVGLQEMKDFMAVMAAYKSAHGTYTTTSTYTPEALQFAQENGIDAVDGRGLLRRIQTRTRQSQQALLAVAYSGHA